MELSIIVPCYNEELAINEFFEEISKICTENNISYELIFVDDGSQDNTLQEIKNLSNEQVRYISFSRNFGKDAAILAGLKKSNGKYTVVMDADLQHPPELLPQMLHLIKAEDIDCVEAFRQNRKGEPIIRSIFVKLYYQLMNKIFCVNIKDGIGDFRLMNRAMVNAICSTNETTRFSKGLFDWVGFKTQCIPFSNRQRNYGKSKWSFWNLFKYAIRGLISFSTTLLYIPLVFGILFLIFSLLFTGASINHNEIYVPLILLTSSLNFIFIGFLGLYIAHIHKEVLNRPPYIIREEK